MNLRKSYDIDVLNNYEKSYNDSLISVMKNKEIVSCFITRGKKYYLYLTKINNENVSLLIDQTTNNDIPKITYLNNEKAKEIHKEIPDRAFPNKIPLFFFILLLIFFSHTIELPKPPPEVPNKQKVLPMF